MASQHNMTRPPIKSTPRSPLRQIPPSLCSLRLRPPLGVPAPGVHKTTPPPHLTLQPSQHQLPQDPQSCQQPRNFLGLRLHGLTFIFFSTPSPSLYIFNRPQEKPAVAPPPVAPSAPPPVSEPAEPAPAPLTNDDSDLIGDGWEDPITVQPPTWDDEPQVKPPPEDAWSSPVQVQADIQDETPSPLPQEEPAPEISTHVPSDPAPAPQQPAEDPIPAPTPSRSPVSVPPRSSAASHRSVNRYKATDQAVVMPTSGFNPGLEKVGMQFGSLSLGGEVIEPSP